MNKLELIEQRNNLRDELRLIVDSAESEGRKLTSEEQTKFDNIKESIANLGDEIKNNKEERKQTKMEKFSLIQTINEIVNNKTINEAARSIIAEGENEMRKSGQNYNGQIQIPIEIRGGDPETNAISKQLDREIVATDLWDILTPLRDKMVLAEAGATFMSGLVGDVKIPTYSGTNVYWESECNEATDGRGEFDSINLTPHRLTCYVDVSKQLLNQTSDSVEQMLRDDIVASIAAKLQNSILQFGGPVGVLSTEQRNDPSSTPDYPFLLNMMTKADASNAVGTPCWITDYFFRTAFSTAKKDEGSGRFIMENGEIDGIQVKCMNIASTLDTADNKTAVYGYFSDIVIGQWGALDITIDPYTQATKGCVRLVVNAYFDAKLRRPKSLQYMKYNPER